LRTSFASFSLPRVKRLLADDEPGAAEFVAGREASSFVVLVDHASPRVPRALGSLGLDACDLERHIAWDIGALGLARHLAAATGGCLVAQNYSRLVIDCNRPLTSPDSIVAVSDGTEIPGNQGISAEDGALRAAEIFEPYHARVRRELEERRERGQATVLVFVHSFTPVLGGSARAWHAGVLHLEDTRLAMPLLAGLRHEPGLVVGDNEPYAASRRTDYSLVEHGLGRSLLHVELEVRQDLVEGEAGQEEWALRLARLLEESIRFRQ
jgi:predicted N-formylglutamate amidohydrolase